MTKQRILSGMRSSNSRLHLGNYEGALRQWVSLQDEYEMFCMVADWHSLTTLKPGETFDVGYNCIELVKDYIAGGLDPEKCAIFIQSHVPAHAELNLVFSMITGLGKLERVPTFKEKKDDMGAGATVSYGLLGYPVLQSADIYLYRPYGVPVGKDQAAHLELSREIGRSFNAIFNCEVFGDFKSIFPEDESRSKLPGLDADENGMLRKMSKSYDNCIYINETPEETAKKIKKAFTTPSKISKSDPGIPEGCAVCQYLKLYSPDWQKQWQEDREGIRGCAQNKNECIEVVNSFLEPMRAKRAALTDDDIRDVLAEGRKKANLVAEETMEMVREAMKMAPLPKA